eukprot:GFKZ01014927.1.p1 GENE.GFKZ01014927.1~~GFKZ01014927.1.p1  ORF type:complete len:315 (+),score=28.00 GFKZ01014927.1:268-1212(+)
MGNIILKRRCHFPSSSVLVFFLFLSVTSIFVQWDLFGLSNPTTELRVPTVWIVSHRRSGTHLSMDLLAEILPKPFRLVKTNHVYLTDDQTASETEDGLNCRCLNFMRRRGRIIHAHRDVRDVVTSTFYYYKSFGSAYVKDVNKSEFFANVNGARNMVIEKWVNTTAPFFAQDDILQLPFSDCLSGFGHVQDRIMSFLHYRVRNTSEINPTKMESASHAVAKQAGKGDHGYKLDMSRRAADEILETARRMEREKRENMESCGGRRNRLTMGLAWVQDLFYSGLWVGGEEEYGLWAPSYCPPTFEGSRVVIRRRTD